MSFPFAFFSPSPAEMLIILGVAVLLFGKRLPEVGRSLGKGIVEFKKGINGIENEIDTATYASTSPSQDVPTTPRHEASAPKFEPPSAEPKAETAEG